MGECRYSADENSCSLIDTAKEMLMDTQIILASASPRRQSLMESAGIPCRIVPADVDEFIPKWIPPRIACMYNALRKAQNVSQLFPDQYVIGADTIVWDGRILGKPEDEEEAFRTLSELRNRAHSVYTGVCIAVASKGITRVFCDRTDVVFGDYSDEEIREYIATGEPADKAGSYAIQGNWGAHVRDFHGDRNNVIGLPVSLLREELLRLGAEI